MAKRKQEGAEAPLDDRVGYGRPPKEHRFEKGHPGNPWGCKGKPKPERDFLDQRQHVRVDGRWRWVTRDETIDHALYKEALSGNVSAAKQLEARQQKRLAKRAQGADADTLSAEDRAALMRAVARAVPTGEGSRGFLKKGAEPDGEPDEEDER